MEQKQSRLSEIEKQLVLREVAKRGKDVVESEVLKPRDDQMYYDKKNWQVCFTRPPKLSIKETFSQSQMGTDSLAKTIFDRIHEIEKESGYFPDPEVANCTNYLGTDTRYYWVKEDKEKQMCGVVEVKSNFVDRESLLEIIKNN